MAKKAVNAPAVFQEVSAAPPVKKTAVTRARKHVKAQAAAVVAAVEEFVTTMAHPEKTAKPVTHEDVSRLAYQFYLERGGMNGSPSDDWRRAEQALIG